MKKSMKKQSPKGSSLGKSLVRRKLSTPMKFDLPDVIYEEENELTVTQVKEREMPLSGKKTTTALSRVKSQTTTRVDSKF